ncbi:MAG: aspartate carbamoyltransferase catalytic subunit [Bdellovibrio sp.]
MSHFLDLTEIGQDQLLSWIERAHWFLKNPRPSSQFSGSVALLFFEASTRTRLSFAQAAFNLGLQTLDLGETASSSISKGESFEDTCRNVAAMGPRLCVIRCGDELDLAVLASELPCPVLNAGWGKKAHPTQSLLDLACLWSERKSIWFRRILFWGDVSHSRVVSSHQEIAKIFSIEIGQWGPPALLKKDEGIKTFQSASQALQWADVVIGLRSQRERHSGEVLSQFLPEHSLDIEKLKFFSSSGLILHPGPIHWGCEFQPEVAKDSRQRILQQVSHGVALRQSLMVHFLEAKRCQDI